jgi:hypothetical protein
MPNKPSRLLAVLSGGFVYAGWFLILLAIGTRGSKNENPIGDRNLFWIYLHYPNVFHKTDNVSSFAFAS